MLKSDKTTCNHSALLNYLTSGVGFGLVWLLSLGGEVSPSFGALAISLSWLAQGFELGNPRQSMELTATRH
jgi:hypothetical protein